MAFALACVRVRRETTCQDDARQEASGTKGDDVLLPDPRERPTVTVPEAGELLGLSRATAYESAGRGELPTIRMGRRLLVPTAGLLRLLHLDERDPDRAA